MFFSCGLVTLVYSWVVRMLAWPRSFCTCRISTPFSRRWVAKLCRKLWKVAFFFIPTDLSVFANTIWAVLVVRQPPRSLSNTYSSESLPIINSPSCSRSFSGKMLIRSLLPFACLMWRVSSSKSTSPALRFTTSLTLRPDPYASATITRCFLFRIASMIWEISLRERTIGSFLPLFVYGNENVHSIPITFSWYNLNAEWYWLSVWGDRNTAKDSRKFISSLSPTSSPNWLMTSLTQAQYALIVFWLYPATRIYLCSLFTLML